MVVVLLWCPSRWSGAFVSLRLWSWSYAKERQWLDIARHWSYPEQYQGSSIKHEERALWLSSCVDVKQRQSHLAVIIIRQQKHQTYKMYSYFIDHSLVAIRVLTIMYWWPWPRLNEVLVQHASRLSPQDKENSLAQLKIIGKKRQSSISPLNLLSQRILFVLQLGTHCCSWDFFLRSYAQNSVTQNNTTQHHVIQQCGLAESVLRPCT